METHCGETPPPSLDTILNELAEQIGFRLRLSAAKEVRQMQCALVAQICAIRSEIEEASSYSDYTDWTDDDVEDFVLTDDSNELIPLFRYCIATKTRRFGVADMYTDAAVQQYLIERK
ncbi:MAG: hypothetical protein WD229_05395, partial [Pirellulales bacterium]